MGGGVCPCAWKITNPSAAVSATTGNRRFISNSLFVFSWTVPQASGRCARSGNILSSTVASRAASRSAQGEVAPRRTCEITSGKVGAWLRASLHPTQIYARRLPFAALPSRQGARVHISSFLLREPQSSSPASKRLRPVPRRQADCHITPAENQGVLRVPGSISKSSGNGTKVRRSRLSTVASPSIAAPGAEPFTNSGANSADFSRHVASAFGN